MVPDLVRDSFLGRTIYLLSGRRLLQYPEERRDFVLPKSFETPSHLRTRPTTSSEVRPASSSGSSSSSVTANPRQSEATAVADQPRPQDIEKQQKHFVDGAPSSQTAEHDADDQDPNVVDWYGPDDPECPSNWSFSKKCFVTFDICLLTFAIYIGSAIYAPGTQQIAMEYGISSVAATLGLTMFVAGYAIGPMFLSPLSEIPQLGRTSVYIITLALFVIVQVPTIFARSLGALLPLRFIAGFIGSPPLATGGASLADIWEPDVRAIAIGVWGLAAVCGPVLGPLLGGFVTQANGWTWNIWVLMWLSGGALVFLIIFLPETSSQAILHRRAVRLRRLTGNPDLKSRGEIESAHMTAGQVAQMTLVRPIVLGFTESIVLAWNVYIALVYGILYIFIESFYVVFVEKHGFNLGENGLAFMGLFVGAVVAYLAFVPYALSWLRVRFRDGVDKFTPEDRLPPAMVGAFALPISLFWFGWTSANIHWIVPIVGSSFFSIGTFGLFQAGLNYLQDCYPRYNASVLAGNDLFRSLVGAGFPLFSTAFFHNLGVGPACSILGGITILMIPIPFVLYKYGARIRRMSSYTD